MDAPIVIAPSYRINALNYQEYLSLVKTSIEGGAKAIVFDFHDVEFIDTYGLSVLIKGFRMSEKVGASFRVRGVRYEEIKMIFRVTNIERFFPVEYVNSNFTTS